MYSLNSEKSGISPKAKINQFFFSFSFWVPNSMLEANKCNPFEAQHLNELTLVFPIGLTKSNFVYLKGMMKKNHICLLRFLDWRLECIKRKKKQPKYIVVLKDLGVMNIGQCLQ